jgi:hypothetical protein
MVESIQSRSQVLWLYALIGAGAVSLAVVWNAANNERFWKDGGGDYRHYARAAVAGNGSVPAPWRYRVLFPRLAASVSAMGMPEPVAFLCVTVCASVLGCAAFGVLLEGVGFGVRGASLGVGMFAASCGGWVPVRGYGYPDALANLFLICALLCLLRRRFVLAGGLIALGVVAKESLLLLVPLGALVALRARGLREALILALLPMAAYTGVRCMVGRGIDEHGFLSVQNVDFVLGYWRTAMTDGPMRWLAWAAVYSLGPLWILAALNVRATKTFVLNMIPYAGTVLIPLVLTTDTDRVFCLLFPLVIPMAVYSAEGTHGRRWGLFAASVVLAVVVCQATFTWRDPLKPMVVALLCSAPACLALARKDRSANRPVRAAGAWFGPGRVW